MSKTSYNKSKMKWNFYSVFGLRGLRKRWIGLIVLCRITRHLDNHVLCMCGRYVSWMSVWSVCTPDAFLCNECMKESTNGDYDNESDYVKPLPLFGKLRSILN